MPTRLNPLLLTELSLVDLPANKDARVTIFKRGSNQRDEGGSQMTEKNAKDNKTEKNANPTPEDLQKQIDELTGKLEAATKASEDANKAVELQGQIDEINKELAESKEALEKAEAEKAEAEAVAKLSDAEKQHLETLDAEKRAEFLGMDAEKRQKVLKAKDENDEEVEVEGRKIKKSAVGEDQFAIFKAQADRIRKAEEEIQKANDRAEEAELTKRAEEAYGHLPGELPNKVAVLKAVSKFDEETRKALETMLEAGDKAIKAAYDTIGSKGGKEVNKDAKAFEGRIAEIRKRDDCSRTDAMAKARKEFPDEFKAYQEAN